MKGKYRFVPIIRAGCPGHGELLQCFREMLTCVEDKNHSPLAEWEMPEGVRRREGNELYMKAVSYTHLDVYKRQIYLTGFTREKARTGTAREWGWRWQNH